MDSGAETKAGPGMGDPGIWGPSPRPRGWLGAGSCLHSDSTNKHRLQISAAPPENQIYLRASSRVTCPGRGAGPLTLTHPALWPFPRPKSQRSLQEGLRRDFLVVDGDSHKEPLSPSCCDQGPPRETGALCPGLPSPRQTLTGPGAMSHVGKVDVLAPSLGSLRTEETIS